MLVIEAISRRMRGLVLQEMGWNGNDPKSWIKPYRREISWENRQG